MTLGDYLSREAPYAADQRCWWGLWAYLSLVFLVFVKVLKVAGPPDIRDFLVIGLAVSYMVGLGVFEHTLTRRLSRRHGLLCPHCGEPFRITLLRRAGQFVPVTVCRRCRQPVVEAAGSDSDTKVCYLPITLHEYVRRAFNESLERASAPRGEPEAPEPEGALPTTLDDYFRREVAYGEHICHWQLVGAGLYFGSLFVFFFLLLMPLNLAGVVPGVVCGVALMVF